MSDCTAFSGNRCVAKGSNLQVALELKRLGLTENILIFEDATGRQIDFDLSGDESDIARRLVGPGTEEAPRGRGRPRLGVVSREVTLLPRHWEWLGRQRGGASAALRRLIDEARTADIPDKRVDAARARADRFMLAMLGDQPGYEEASRALYAGDRQRFDQMSAAWPADLRDHARMLAEEAFA